MIQVVRLFSSVFIALTILTLGALAHIPVIVKNKSSKENPVLVTKPEISYAYYGELAGEPHYYKIEAPRPFHLYVNILVPDFAPQSPPVSSHNMSFEILRDSVGLFTKEGPSAEWTRFYEKYGRDHYYMGPEFENDMGKGTYYIRVYNPNNTGRYALAIGKKENFTPISIISAFFKAWSLDKWFFKPPRR